MAKIKKEFQRDGDGDPRRVTPKSKDWAFRRPVEGRVRKEKKVTIKLKHVVWDLMDTILFLLQIKAGLPECNWMITAENPARKLTSRDVLYILTSNEDEFEIKYNEDHKVIQFQDIAHLIQSSASDEMAPTINNS